MATNYLMGNTGFEVGRGPFEVYLFICLAAEQIYVSDMVQCLYRYQIGKKDGFSA